MNNSKPKHTPGPWVISKATYDGEVIDITPIGVQLVSTDNGPENWKNARLIAAAPECLEFLQGFVAKVKRGEPINFTDAFVAGAIKAILKATGDDA